MAAWFSKARNSTRVEVDYTRVKYVRKPSGAKPGMVIYVNYNTVIVDPVEPKSIS
jgi:predicted ribosome quality control (RQC) complex YloA/Tae2 family protein